MPYYSRRCSQSSLLWHWCNPFAVLILIIVEDATIVGYWRNRVKYLLNILIHIYIEDATIAVKLADGRKIGLSVLIHIYIEDATIDVVPMIDAQN